MWRYRKKQKTQKYTYNRRYSLVFVVLEVFGAVHEHAADESATYVDRVGRTGREVHLVAIANATQLLARLHGELHVPEVQIVLLAPLLFC